MTLVVEKIVCGPMKNNSYVVFDETSKAALVIDPSIGTARVVDFIRDRQLLPQSILITHAHFDHFHGVPLLLQSFPSISTVMLHENDLGMWQNGGGAKKYIGEKLEVIAPLKLVSDDEVVQLDEHRFAVRLSPGHSAGSVIYYSAELACAFVGDVIFFHSIGRTDLEDGDSELLIESIRRQVFSLPDKTILYPGHGPTTTVREEKLNNPFL